MGLRLGMAMIAMTVTLTGCATNVAKEISKIQVGMDKSQVIDRIGSPSRKRRWQGQDEWTYLYYVNDKQQGTHLFFKNGEVVDIKPIDLTNTKASTLEGSESFEEYKRAVEKKAEEHQKGFKDIDDEKDSSD